jgi:hypothetical protein
LHDIRLNAALRDDAMRACCGWRERRPLGVVAPARASLACFFLFTPNCRREFDFHENKIFITNNDLQVFSPIKLAANLTDRMKAEAHRAQSHCAAHPARRRKSY